MTARQIPVRYCRALIISGLMLVCTGCGRDAPVEDTPAIDATESVPVVVYSTYGAEVVKPVFDAYTEETGLRVYLLTGSYEHLTGKVHQPGSDPVADLFIADNVADLWRAAEQDVFRPTRSDVIAKRVPAQLRDPEHLWTALGVRARVIAYNTQLVDAAEIGSVSDYASLGAEDFRDRLCLSSSTVAANVSLIAMLINDNGIRDAEVIVRGWRANLATSGYDGDHDLLQAIAAGQCALGVADSSEVARFLGANAGSNLAAHWFQDPGVTHINASGGGVTRHAKNAAGAVSLLHWLTSESANALFVLSLLEFPANAGAVTPDAIAAWSGFEANPVNLSGLGYLQEDASKLADRARYP